MSTVAEEITRISGCREDIKTAIAAKGVTVPATAKLADCPALIASITGGGGSVDSFINTGFTASGEYTYTRPFTATQNGVPQYDTAVTSYTIQAPFNFDGTFASIPVTMGNTEYSDFNFEISIQKDQWNTFRTTAGQVYTSTQSNHIGIWYATGNSNTPTGMLSGVVTNGAGLTGNVTFYFRSQFTDYGATGLTMDITAYTVTGTALPYPQYAETSTGLYSASTLVDNAHITATTASTGIKCTVSYTASKCMTFDDGPSYTAAPTTNTTDINLSGDTVYKESVLLTPTTSANSNYTFVYGASASAYDGYRGM